MTKPSTSGGYDGSLQGSDSSNSDDAPLQWTLRKPEFFWSERVMGQLYCGDVARGVIYFESEEEFESLKTRIEGS